jgi:transmembrane sensor
MNIETENWNAIAKYLKGELTEEERHALTVWVKAHPDHKQVFEEVKSLWIATDQDDDFEVDTERNWQRFQNNIAAEKQPDVVQEPLVAAKQVSILPMLFRVAAVLVVGLFLAYFLINGLRGDQMLVMQTAPHETREFYLPDSSSVVLNGNSKLSYAKDFDAANRVVHLEGEAFFEVRKAEGHRFIVYARNTKTEVLGTSFVVSAYADRASTEVKVVTGKVAFSMDDESNTVFLEPGSKGILIAAMQKVEKGEIENTNFLSWKTGSLKFDNTNFRQVILALESHFGTTIEVASPNILNCNYSGTFNRPDIESTLDVICATMNLILTKTGNGYRVSGPGCN